MSDVQLQPWTVDQKIEWYVQQNKLQVRSYADEVLLRAGALDHYLFNVEGYGQLTFNPDDPHQYALPNAPDPYDLIAITSNHWNENNPTIGLTGGVHGCEPSGVRGIFQFLERKASRYTSDFNFVVLPCVSPWSFEHDQRLNPFMENPNREFKIDGKAAESTTAAAYLVDFSIDGDLDLHETVDKDATEFLPVEYAKNGRPFNGVTIDDGYYLIGVEGYRNSERAKAIIQAAGKFTHVAQPDRHGNISDAPMIFNGFIETDIPGVRPQFTRASQLLGAYTTEMYPDSPRWNHLSGSERSQRCTDTQMASIQGFLDHIRLETA